MKGLNTVLYFQVFAVCIAAVSCQAQSQSASGPPSSMTKPVNYQLQKGCVCIQTNNDNNNHYYYYYFFFFKKTDNMYLILYLVGT